MRVSPKLLIFEILAFLVFAILAAAGFLAWRLSQGPIDLNLIRPQVERSLSEARGGQPVKIEALVLEWVQSKGRVEAAARGLTALDASNKTVFRAERAAISLDAPSLIAGKFKTRQLRLESGVASVVRSKDGVWTLADLVLAKEPTSDKPFDPLRDINWSTLATPIRALISAGSFERVELAGFHIEVADKKAGTVWVASPVNGVWSAGADGVALDLNLKLLGNAEPNRIVISLASDGAVSRAVGRLTLEGADPVSVARMFGYAGEDFVSATPANAAFTIEATEAGGLQSTRIALSDVSGHARLGQREIAVSGLSVDAVYDPATKVVTLASLKANSDLLAGEITGSMDVSGLMSGDRTKPTAIKLSGKNFSLGLMPMFETPWPFASADIEASLSPDMSKLTLVRLNAVTGGLTAAGSGEFWLEGEPGKRQLGVKVNAVGNGVITPQQVTAFWPVNLGAGARLWVKDRVTAGKASKAVFVMNMPPGALAKGYLDNEHLSLDFTIDDGTVRFLDDFPPATNITGTGRLKGNSIELDLTGGKVASWQADEGKVALAQFAPRGKMLNIAVSGRGDLGQMMRVLEASNLKVGTRYGLQVDQMKGVGGVELHVQRPTHDAVANDEILYSVKGGFREAAATNLVAGFGLTSSDVTFDLNQDGMRITGAGQFGPAPVVFDWKERFIHSGENGSELTASARVTPDLLNAFGVAARNFMQGEAAVELRAAGPGGRDFASITANLDLTRAQLDIPEFGWRKKYDAPAQGGFRYGKDDSGGAIITGDIKSEGLELTGEARMDQANTLVSANIERLFSRGSVDLRGGIARRSDGGYRISLNGPLFDASPWMDSFLSMGGEKTDMHGEAVGPAEPGPLMDLQLSAERLRLREDADLTAAKVALLIDAKGPRSGTITGAIGKDKTINVDIGTTSNVRNVVIRSDDAGFGARVLLKTDYLIGGKLNVDSSFVGSRGTAMVTMSDVRLKDAPLVAQLFSMASLRGLADVLSGEGVLFTNVEAPIGIQNGRIDVKGLRASGPAMGITARGWVSPKDSELSLDGVVVPSFGVNSLLGGLPIIGDLFVSRKGEGMFAPTYSVRGTFAKAQVSMNPVAAVTPGVLRRIFENPGEPPPVADIVPATPPPDTRN